MLFSIDRFLPFLDLFQQDRTKVEMCKSVLEAFLANQKETTSDPVIVGALTYIGKVRHASKTLTFLSLVSFEDAFLIVVIVCIRLDFCEVYVVSAPLCHH